MSGHERACERIIGRRRARERIIIGTARLIGRAGCRDHRAHRSGPDLAVHRPLRADDGAAALANGAADRRCMFEVLPVGCPRAAATAWWPGRAGCWRRSAGSGSARRSWSGSPGCVDAPTLAWLADYRFTGDIDGYPEGELSSRLANPEVSGRSPRPSCWRRWRCRCSTTTARSPRPRPGWSPPPRAAADRDGVAAHPRGGRGRRRPARPTWPGSPRRPTWRPGRRYGIPTAGTAAHAYVLLHDDELAAFRGQVGCLGTETTLLVDTYDIRRGIENGVAAAGPGLGAVRIDSGDLGVLARQARDQLDGLGATGTRIVLSGDLDEYAIAALRAEPVDSYGVGTSVVTGSGRADRGPGLQAGRGRRAAGGQAQRVQGVPGRGASRRCAGTSRRAPRSRRSCTAG